MHIQGLDGRTLMDFSSTTKCSLFLQKRVYVCVYTYTHAYTVTYMALKIPGVNLHQ